MVLTICCPSFQPTIWVISIFKYLSRNITALWFYKIVAFYSQGTSKLDTRMITRIAKYISSLGDTYSVRKQTAWTSGTNTCVEGCATRTSKEVCHSAYLEHGALPCSNDWKGCDLKAKYSLTKQFFTNGVETSTSVCFFFA